MPVLGLLMTTNIMESASPASYRLVIFLLVSFAPRRVSQPTTSSHCGDPGCAEGIVFLFCVCSSRNVLSLGH